MKKTGNRVLLAILLIVIAAGCFYLMNYLFDHTKLVPDLFMGGLAEPGQLFSFIVVCLSVPADVESVCIIQYRE